MSYCACKYDNFVTLINVWCNWLRLVQEINVQECNVHKNYKQISKFQTKYLQYHGTFPWKCLLQYYSRFIALQWKFCGTSRDHLSCRMQSEDKENNADSTRVTVWKSCDTQTRVDSRWRRHLLSSFLTGCYQRQSQRADTHKYRFESSDLPQQAMTLSKHKLLRQDIIVCYCLAWSSVYKCWQISALERLL